MNLWRSSEKAQPARAPVPTVIPEMQGAEVGASYNSERTGGDFFEFLCIGGSVLLVAMFDIAGKRHDTLAIAASIQQILRSESPALISEQGNVNEALSSLALALNRGIIKQEGIHNCPAFLAAFEEESSILSFINAGHTPALLKDRDGVEQLPAGGVPLGLFSHVVHEAQVTVVQEGAVLLIPSRGIIEAKAGTQEFGIERVREVLAGGSFTSAKDITDQVLQSVHRFASTPSFWGPRLNIPGFADHDANDMTVVALMRRAPSWAS